MSKPDAAIEPRLYIGVFDGRVLPIAESENRDLMLKVAEDILQDYGEKARLYEESARGLVYGTQLRRLKELFTEMGLGITEDVAPWHRC